MAHEGPKNGLRDLGRPLCDTPATWLPYTRHLGLPNNFFAITGRQNDRTGDGRQIKAKSCLQTSFPRASRHVSGLPLAQFKDCRAVRLKVLPKVWQDRPVGVVAVRAAVKCCARLVIGDLRHQGADVRAFDVGRVGDDQVEASGRWDWSNRRQRMRTDRPDQVAWRSLWPVPRHPGQMSSPMPKADGNSVSSASSRQPVPVPRSRMRRGGGRPAKAASAASIEGFRSRDGGLAWRQRPGTPSSRTRGVRR